MSGRLIAFEGIEGAGKSTQVRLLEERLRAAGEEVHCFREPGGTEFGESVRTLFKADHPIGALSELLLIGASRAHLMRSAVIPALESGAYVLLDRFVDSTVAYQGFGRGLDIDRVGSLNEWVTGGRRPDGVVYLRLEARDALARMESRGEPQDRMERESEAFFGRIVDGFDHLARSQADRWTVLDALDPVETISERVWNWVRDLGPASAVCVDSNPPEKL